MSDLSYLERHKLEKLFGMASGYVLEFSNRSFQEFVVESTGKDIFCDKYEQASNSKAHRLRAFWSKEPSHIVAKLIGDLLEYCGSSSVAAGHGSLLDDCWRIAERLRQCAAVQELDAITPNSEDRDFEVLAKSVKDSIDKNEPECALDRLHTFVVKYMRVLCDRYGLTVDKNKPLHSLVGEYVKNLKGRGLIESQMTERILKSSISTLEAFNDVRNNQTFAHDNPVLNYNESLLIFNHVASAIRFITALERQYDERDMAGTQIESDEIPF